MVAIDSVGSGQGQLVGTPAPGSAGIYNLKIEASNAAGTTTQPFTLTVGDTPAITSASSVGFVIGNSPSTFAITTSGFPAPSLSCDSPCALPHGLSFHDNGDGTAQIFGAAASDAVSSTVTLTATNGSGTATQHLTVNASLTGGPTVSTTYSNASNYADFFTIGQSDSYTLQSSSTRRDLRVRSDLPDGVTFHDDGNGHAITVSGTPACRRWRVLQPGRVREEPSGGGQAGIAFLEELEVFGSPSFTRLLECDVHLPAPRARSRSWRAACHAPTFASGRVLEARYTTWGSRSAAATTDGAATISGTPDPGSAGIT